MNERGFGLLGIVVVIAIITVLGGGLYYWKMQNRESLTQPTKDQEQSERVVQQSNQEIVQKMGGQSQTQTEQQNESLSPINVATTPLSLRQENVSSNDRDIYYLHEGDILTVDIANKKQMTVVGTPENIAKFSLSPNGLYLYWINDKGELWKQDVAGASRTVLVSIAQDMKEVIQETRGDVAPYPYLKGKVLDFWLSPDGNYIAYKTLEGHTGWGAGYTTFPVELLNIMRNDGTEKVKIVETKLRLGSLTSFVGWLPDSTKIIFTFRFPDEATSGRPYQEAGIDGQSSKQYMNYYKGYDGGDYISLVGTKPLFSSDGKKIVYIDDFMSGEPTIRLTVPDGSWQKDLETTETNIYYHYLYDRSSPQWSRDDNVIFIATDKKMFLFDKNGAKIAESKPSQSFECTWCTERGSNYQGGYRSAILAPDNVSIWSTFGIPSTEKGKEAKIIFIENLTTKERKEYQLNELSQASINFDLQFAENGKLYYMAKNSADKQSKPSLYTFDEIAQRNYLIANDVPQVVSVKK